MVFVVAIDPASIDACGTSGDIGEDLLVGVFEALLQNCLLAEIAGSWRLGAELKEAVKRLPEGDARKRVGAILETLGSPDRCRLVDVIDGFEGDYDTPVTEMLVAQGENVELDAIVCEKQVAGRAVEAMSILAFNRSNFARDRSRKACALVCAAGARQAGEVLREAFGRIVRHAEAVEIFDREMGKHFTGNYFDALAHWCQFFRGFGREIIITVHTTKGREASIERKLREELDGSPVGFRVRPHEEDAQPHDRFLCVRGFTFDIGRGIDLFDRDGRCRDVKIGLSDDGAFTREWRHLF
jgi:hypothetical protein